MTRSAPQAVRPALEGAAFGEKGHGRILNRLSWFHVLAIKANRPRLSAYTSGCAVPLLPQGTAFACVIPRPVRAIRVRTVYQLRRIRAYSTWPSRLFSSDATGCGLGSSGSKVREDDQFS
jgi:hypothetical protein